MARHRWRLLGAAVALAGVLYAAVGPGLLALAWSRIDARPTGVLSGIVRILLTPQPWSLESNYEYLLLPSTLHLLCVIPAMLGLASLWRAVPGARLGIAYFVLIVLVFAAFPQQQGPRHRYQAVFMLVWGLVHLVRTILPILAARLGRVPTARYVAGHAR